MTDHPLDPRDPRDDRLSDDERRLAADERRAAENRDDDLDGPRFGVMSPTDEPVPDLEREDALAHERRDGDEPAVDLDQLAEEKDAEHETSDDKYVQIIDGRPETLGVEVQDGVRDDTGHRA